MEVTVETTYNRNGGLTLVPMNTKFQKMAQDLKPMIEERGTKTDIAIPKFGYRANSEPFVQLGKKHIGGHDCVILDSGPGTPEQLIFLLFLLGYLAGRRAARITLILGYFPLSRSDKDEGELELALAPHVAHLLISASYGKLDRIIAADLHAPQVAMAGHMGLITEIHLMRRVLIRAFEDAGKAGFKDKLVVHYPDVTASKRYEKAVSQAAGKTGIQPASITYGMKRRTNSRQSDIDKIIGDVSKIPDALVISPDDEGATLGTVDETGGIIKNQYGGRAFWPTVIHPVLCSPATERLSGQNIDRLYTMSTIPLSGREEFVPFIENGKLVVISWLDDLAKVIFYHHTDQSIRELR
jgi:ribose-phosphate pyrophosphokinase